MSRLNKADLIDQIGYIRERVQQAVDYAGLKIDSLMYYDAEVHSDLKVTDLHPAWSWCKTLLNDYYLPWRRYYNQQTPQYWDSLVLFGDPETYPEYVELQSLTKELLKQLRAKTKPDIFKKSKVRKVLKSKKKTHADT